MWTFITNPDSTTWLIIDRIGILLGFGALGLAFHWWRRLRRRVGHIRQEQHFARGSGVRPVALSIFWAGGSMDADIRRYMAEILPGWDLPELPLGAEDPGGEKRCPMVSFEHAETSVTAAGAGADLERLRDVAAWLKEEGFNEVHLFMRGTIAFGAAVGCLFANWGAVHVHHFNQSTYEFWFSLVEVKRIAASRSLADDITDALARRLASRQAPVAEPPRA